MSCYPCSDVCNLHIQYKCLKTKCVHLRYKIINKNNFAVILKCNAVVGAAHMWCEYKQPFCGHRVRSAPNHKEIAVKFYWNLPVVLMSGDLNSYLNTQLKLHQKLPLEANPICSQVFEECSYSNFSVALPTDYRLGEYSLTWDNTSSCGHGTRTALASCKLVWTFCRIW